MKLQNKTRIQFNSNPDLQLKFRIRRILHSAGYAALNAIRIEVHRSEVYLEGTVTSYFMKQMAQELIMTVDEVKKAHNFLTVDSTGQQPEEKLILDHARSVEYHL
ncbi:MAG: BON domain-containing protein [Planctomycetaceae bacterium]|nr:BON domain-containing protein [Planctomycetaceae bacterium]